MSSRPEWLSHLNDAQYEGVTHSGSHLQLLAGPGSGKCVAPDTWVWSAGLRRFGDLFDERASRIETGFGPSRVEGWYDDGERDGRLVRLACGLEIDATDAHPLWVRRPDGTEGWVRAAELTTDDYVGLARGCADFGPEEIPDDEAYLLGLIVADGGRRKTGLQIENHRRVLEAVLPTVQRLRRYASEFVADGRGAAGVDAPIEIRDRSAAHAYIEFESAGFGALMRARYGYEHGGSRADRRVPDRVLRGTRQTVRQFLRGYFDGDGYCDEGGPAVSIASAEMARQVTLLLLGLGVYCRVRVLPTAYRRPNGKLRPCLPVHSVQVRDSVAFRDEIGFAPYGLTKDENFAKHLTRRRNTNIDPIPYVGRVLGAALDAHAESAAPGRLSVVGRRYAGEGRRLSYERLRWFLDRLCPSPHRDELERIASERRAWSRVETVTVRRSRRIDCTVPGRHSFVGNGVVNHNTSVITHRCAYLVRERAVDPRRILLCTFTNKAAREIKDRLDRLLGDRGKGLWMGTFHSICVRLLRAYHRTVDLPEDFTILDQDAQKNLLLRSIREMRPTLAKTEQSIFDDSDPATPYVTLFSRLKDSGVWPEDAAQHPLLLRFCRYREGDAASERSREITHELYRRYQASVRAYRAADFGDLIIYGLRLFRDETVAANLGSRWHHIVVDEAQDTNVSQYQLIRSLASGSRPQEVCIVGDEDQCIYGWRGADFKNLMNFAKDFPNVRQIVLGQNYRSTRQIVATCRRLIERNSERYDKELFTSNRDGLPPVADEFRTDDDEAHSVALRVKESIADGVEPKEIAVLYRASYLSRAVEQELRACGVAYHVVGGFRFYDREEIRDVISYLRFLVNPASEIDFERIINVPTRGLGSVAVDRIRLHAASIDASLVEGARQLALVPRALTEPQRDGVRKFVAVYDELLPLLARAVSIADLLDAIVRVTNYADYAMSRKQGNGQDRLDNIAELSRSLRKLQQRRPELTLARWLQELAILAGEEQSQDDSVVLSTVHACVDPRTTWVETAVGLQRAGDVRPRGTIGTTIGARRYRNRVDYPVGRMLRIETRSGYAVGVTPNHGIMAWDGTEFVECRADRLRVGDWVRMKLGVAIDPAEPAPLPAAPPVRALVEHKIPTEMTEELAEFLGLFVADGTRFRRGFRITKGDADVIARAAFLCDRLFGSAARVARDHHGTPTAEFSSTQVSAWLSALGGLEPRAKHVPACVLRSSSRFQRAFLRGLFEDGTVSVKGGTLDHVDWSNKSEDLVRLVQVMLLRLGIVSSCRPVLIKRLGTYQWHLYVFGAYASKFGAEIGFISSKKNHRCRATSRAAGTRYTIPVSRQMVETVLPRREVLGTSKLPTRQNALRRGSLSVASCIQYGFPVDLGFHYERISRIRSYLGPSMCVEVPGHGRFLQNGIDGCNSKGREFRHVHLVGAQEGVFPNSRAEIEEERRLMYVAISRAKERFFATYHLGERKEPSQPSRFLQEAGIEIRRLQSTTSQNPETATRKTGRAGPPSRATVAQQLARRASRPTMPNIPDGFGGGPMKPPSRRPAGGSDEGE